LGNLKEQLLQKTAATNFVCWLPYPIKQYFWDKLTRSLRTAIVNFNKPWSAAQEAIENSFSWPAVAFSCWVVSLKKTRFGGAPLPERFERLE